MALDIDIDISRITDSSSNYWYSFRPKFIDGALRLECASLPANIVSQNFLVKGQKKAQRIPRLQLNSYNSIIVLKPQLLVNVDHVWEPLSALKIRRLLKHTIASAFT